MTKATGFSFLCLEGADEEQPVPTTRRGARKALRQISETAENVRQKMHHLAFDQQGAFRTPRHVTLTYHRSGASPPKLRWRTGYRLFGRQRYVDLFSETERAAVLQRIPSHTQARLREYECHRIQLNLEACLLVTGCNALRRYLAELEQFDALNETTL